MTKKPSKSKPGASKIEVQRASGQVWKRLGPSSAILDVFGSVLDRLGSVLEASWASKTLQHKPGLAMEREARYYSDAFALSGYLLRFSALAICKNSEN